MTPNDQTFPQTTERGTPRSPRKKHRPSMLGYLIVLFTAAFLLLLLSYFMQQRRNDQNIINGLQASISAMQSVETMRAENEALQSRCDQLQTELAALKSQLETQTQETADQQEGRAQAEKTALALDWLWRIEREYFQRRYANTRELIRTFQESGLEEWLPTTPMVDQDYRSPREQYDAICKTLF